MVRKEVILNEEEQKLFGGVKGVMIYMKDGEAVDEEQADCCILNIYDEEGNNIKRIYGDL